MFTAPGHSHQNLEINLNVLQWGSGSPGYDTFLPEKYSSMRRNGYTQLIHTRRRNHKHIVLNEKNQT